MAKHWTTTEVRALRDLHSVGLNANAIADAMSKRFPREYDGGIIRAKLASLGLKGPGRSQAAKLGWKLRRARSQGGSRGRSQLAL